MDFAAMRDTCARQEALLRFDSFDSQTAWALGSAMVEELKRRDLKVCVAIWSLTGYVLFQYAAGAPPSTTRTGCGASTIPSA